MSAAVLDAPPPPAPRKRYTPDDLLRMGDRGRDYELVDGELVEVVVSYQSAWVAGEVHFHLRGHVGPRRLGWVAPEGTCFRCFPDDPDRVRKADVAFHRLDRLTTQRAETEGHLTVCPDLVVEVVSPNDTANEVMAKRSEWLDAGAQLVWVIYPKQREVHVYPAAGAVRVFRAADTLTAEPLLPDFHVPVADLFTLPTG